MGFQPFIFYTACTEEDILETETRNLLSTCLFKKMTQRDGMRREEGGGFRMGNTCIPVADSF